MKAMLQEFDVVASLVDRPDEGVVAGEVGAVIAILAPDVFEVEFVDADGRTYASGAFKGSELLKLHDRSQAAA